MQLFAIGEVSRQTGVPTSTIRYYERIGLLPPSKRINTKRRYDPGILEKLGVIRMAQQAGLSIAEIQTLLHDFPVDTPPSERWQTLAVTKIAELDAQMVQIQAMKRLLQHTLECHCATIEDCAKVETAFEISTADLTACGESK